MQSNNTWAALCFLSLGVIKYQMSFTSVALQKKKKNYPHFVEDKIYGTIATSFWCRFLTLTLV